MANIRISELTQAAAVGTSVVPASDAAGSVTNKVTLADIAALANDAGQLITGTLSDDRLSANVILANDPRWLAIAPLAPTGVTATAGDSVVALQWVAPSSLLDITDYVIEFSDDNGATWTVASDGTSADTTANVTGLMNDTIYSFRVAAVSGVGTGPFSDTATATPAVPTSNWDISTASYVQNFSVSSQDSTVTALAFKTDGTKMYVAGNDGDDINEYSLSSAWDISTASYSKNFSVASQESNPYGLAFKSDGTRMYVTGVSGGDINEYALSSAWDISTASYVQNFSVSSQDGFPTGLTFKDDGTRMYHLGRGGMKVYEYVLSSAWDISTASYAQNFSVSAREPTPHGIAFRSDGTKMFVVGDSGLKVNEYALSTAWDISSASYTQNFSVSSQDGGPLSVAFKTDGTRMYILGNNTDAVYEYSVS